MKAPRPLAPAPLSTFIRDNAWHVLLADGTDRPARDGEVGKLKVSGYTTPLLRQAIVDRADLLEALKLAHDALEYAHRDAGNSLTLKALESATAIIARMEARP